MNMIIKCNASRSVDAQLQNAKGNVLVIDTPARPDQEGIEFLSNLMLCIPCSNTMAELQITLEFVKKLDDLARHKEYIYHIYNPNKIH